MSRLDVRLFQHPGVQLDGSAVAFPFKRVEALFYYLLCQECASRQELVDLLWEERAEENGYKNLRHTLYALRKCLGRDIVLTGSRSEVRLNPEREIAVDHDPAGAVESQDAGAFLRGFTVKDAPSFNAWVDRMREQLSARTLSYLETQADAALARGDPAQAERLALEYLARDSLDEKMVTLLMQLYRREERYYKAVSLYQRLKERLAEELGIAPLHETTALYYEIVNQWNRTAGETAPSSERLSPLGSGAQPLADEAPAGAAELLRRQLEGLSADALDLVRLLSLFQGQAPCRLLSEIAGCDAARLDALWAELRERGLVEELYQGGERCLAFPHPYIREMLYQSQSYAKRQPLHRRIADCLERRLLKGGGGDHLLLVHHCRQCGDAARAVRYQALYLDLYTQDRCQLPPYRHFDSPPLSEDTEDSFRELEQDLRRLRRQGEPQDLDGPERQLLLARSRYLLYTGRYQEGLALVRRELERFARDPAGGPAHLLALQRLLAAYSLQTDQWEGCQDRLAQCLTIAEREGLPDQRACFLLLRGVCFCKEGDFARSAHFLQEAERSAAGCPAIGGMFLALIHGWRGECLRRQEDLPAACREYRLALERVDPACYLPGAGWLYTCYGRAALAAGEDGLAQTLFDTALTAYAATQELPGRALAQCCAAWYAAQARRYDDAAALLADSRASASRQGSLPEQGIRDSVLAMLRRELDRTGAAENALHRFLCHPLEFYCRRGLQRLQGAAGAYERRILEDCLSGIDRGMAALSAARLYQQSQPHE